MSLDCYPLGERRLIALGEQPMAIDAAYDDNLLVTVIDDCRTVVIFDLAQAGQSELQTNLKVGHFQLGDNVVIDQVVHCKTGDFIACVGHKEGQLTLYAVFEWRNNRLPCDDTRDADARRMLRIEELNLNETTIPLDEIDRGDKLTSIGVCQETGNLAASYGDLVIIYRYIDPGAQVAAIAPAESTSQQDSSWHEITSSPEDLAKDLDKLLLSGTNGGGHFKHMVSVKLSIFAARVCLAENYLSIMSLDHVQVLKLELLTLQIQSEGQEGGCQVWSQQQQQQQQVGRSAGGSSGESQAMALARGQRGTSNKTGGKLVADAAAAAADGCRQVAAGGGPEKSGDHGDRDDDETRCDSSASSSCSLATSTGFGSSNQSLVTNFSSLLEGGDIEAGDALLLDSSGGANCGSGTTAANSTTSEQQVDMSQQETTSQQLISNIDSDMSIITMQNLNQVIPGLSNNNNTAVTDANVGQDDCITWNLNTKKLVKLPTLMHNTSTDLSSYHICHPLELLGPASESIACRVSARIYAPDLSQNQLEPVVLLCKQFDFDRDPIKLVQLEPVYLSRAEDQRRLAGGPRGGGGGGGAASATTSAPDSATATVADAADCANLQPLHSSSSSSSSQLLKSRDHELLASISCFVATLANCYIYSLNGKKVTRLQTITFPGLCLDLRADLLNVYLLTPLGLQICSTSICDATFRYDWSSSADLNLSFLARDRVRALTTRDYLVMVSSSSSCASRAGSGSGSSSLSGLQHTQTGSLLEVMRKPHLGELLERIGHTIQRCQSISVRSNLLTYLHASAQLSLIKIEKQKRLAIAAASDENNSRAAHEQLELASRETSVKLKEITIMLAKQLLQKKQTNVITNSRIDKAIKHLMDISFCDLVELMQRHLAAGQNPRPSQAFVHDASVEEEQQQQEDADLNTTLTTEDDDDDDDDDEQPEDSDLELLLIYLRHSKFSQSILDYLKSTGTPVDNDADDDTRAFEKLTNYMFDNNPRLLIKCAQRITRDGARALDNRCRKHLVDKLKQLAEFDSTGINRATVLFTLAILYHQSETSLDTTSQQQCLQALSQIKPQNHLAITMCSNYEIIDQSMARLVESHYSQVFRLFLSQLEKRGDLMAARHFQQLIKQPDTTSSALPGTPDAEILNIENDLKQQVDRSDLEEYEDEDEEGEVYEQNLRLLSELSPLELAELFCCELSQQEDDSQAVRALLKASVNLMESRYILARLSENSR